MQALACMPVVALAMAADDKSKPAAADVENYEVRLIWASNDESSPDPKHKKLDSQLTGLLKKTFKWNNYYEVNSKVLSIPVHQVKEAKLSEVCTVKVRNLGDSRLEADLFGKGKPVSNTKAKLEKWVILAGEAKNDTGWFVVIRKAPKTK